MNLRTFSYSFEYLTEELLRSPFHNKALHAPKVQKKASAFQEDLLRFIKSLDDDYALRNKAFFLLAFDFGLMLAEVCALRIRDIDLNTVPGDLLKNRLEYWKEFIMFIIEKKELYLPKAVPYSCLKWIRIAFIILKN